MPLTKTHTGPDPVRVNKWLAQAGVCSRREAEALIEQGLVSIDGEKVAEPGRKILPGQTLTLAEKGASKLQNKATVLINKPVGYVSAQPEGDQIPAARLVKPGALHGRVGKAPGRGAKLAPLGRLDQDSRGLLILSEDGVLAKAVIGPESLVDKEYRVRVKGRVTEQALGLLRHGLSLDGRKLKPAKVTQGQDGVLTFVLREGRNRQIRRMCDLVGLDVVDLKRVRIGPVDLGDLPEGKWRPMKPAERAALLEMARGAS
ncbi:MAG: pseudouridine synthase [Pseudomonadota bacterium]